MFNMYIIYTLKVHSQITTISKPALRNIYILVMFYISKRSY